MEANAIFLLWYGRGKFWNSKKFYKAHTYKCGLHTKALAFPSLRKGSLYFPTTSVYIPSNWKVVILKNKYTQSKPQIVYLFSNTYFFKLLLVSASSQLLFDRQMNSVTMRNYCLSNFYKLYINKVKQLLQSFSQVFFIKLKFKGKGYYIYKSSRNTITTQFGHAHRIYIYSFFISVKFLSKTSVFLFGTSKSDLLKVGYSIQKARPINIFTGRGVRFTKQIIYRKTGKISTHR